jgi:hypothetical protein
MSELESIHSEVIESNISSEIKGAYNSNTILEYYINAVSKNKFQSFVRNRPVLLYGVDLNLASNLGNRIGFYLEVHLTFHFCIVHS